MLPDRVSNPGPLTYESGALPFALRGPANVQESKFDPLTRRLYKAMFHCSQFLGSKAHEFILLMLYMLGRVVQLVRHLVRKSEVLDSIPGLATYFCFSFC